MEHTFRTRVVSSLDPDFGDVFEFLVDRDQAAHPEACIQVEVRDIRGVDDIKVGTCNRVPNVIKFQVRMCLHALTWTCGLLHGL